MNFQWKLISVQLDDKEINQTLKTASGLYWEIKCGNHIKTGFSEIDPPVQFGHLEFEDTPNEKFLDLIDRKSIEDQLIAEFQM